MLETEKHYVGNIHKKYVSYKNSIHIGIDTQILGMELVNPN